MDGQMLQSLQVAAGGADRFAVIDTETTGVYNSDRVVEVAILTLSLTGEVLDEYETLINPGRDVSASHIHGITASMVASAPTFEDVAGEVGVRLHDACVVAHNVPFDVRMISGEFDRLGIPVVVDRAVDTLAGSGCRLQDACGLFEIDLSGVHSALIDARASAELLRRLGDRCGVGGPAIVAPGSSRSSQVLRRRDQEPVEIPEGPLIAYLASRVPLAGMEVRAQQYLEMVGRAMADLHLDRSERDELAQLAGSLGMNTAQVVQAHRRYVNELVDAAVADDVVTDEEYEMLVRVAAALDVAQDDVERRVMSFRRSAMQTSFAAGMGVVFTGASDRYGREELESAARSFGLEPSRHVSKKTGMVIASDPDSLSGKAKKARVLGIPIISIDQFLESGPGAVFEASATTGSLKVQTCPDCLATTTVAAGSSAHASKRCSDCSAIQRSRSEPPGNRPPERPSIEWLTCMRCTTSWSRPIVRGRKPHYCPDCEQR